MRENSIIRWLAQLAQPHPAEMQLGIGDDAAVFAFAKQVVFTTDLICDGTHFRLNECTARQIGHKAIAVNLSDIAAMAARPVAAFVSLLLPRDVAPNFCTELMSSLVSTANEYGCVVAGGDTNTWNGGLVINVAVVGETTAAGPLLRSGAQPGDALLVTGALGGSLQGHHLAFSPRIREAIQLREHYQIHAGMDLSDGLAMDLRRLCDASLCGAELDAAALPLSEAVIAAESDPSKRIQRALGDGEDFELLLAVPQEEAERILRDQPLSIPITRIGRCLLEKEVWLVSRGSRASMPEVGYEHGSQADDR